MAVVGRRARNNNRRKGPLGEALAIIMPFGCTCLPGRGVARHADVDHERDEAVVGRGAHVAIGRRHQVLEPLCVESIPCVGGGVCGPLSMEAGGGASRREAAHREANAHTWRRTFMGVLLRRLAILSAAAAAAVVRAPACPCGVSVRSGGIVWSRSRGQWSVSKRAINPAVAEHPPIDHRSSKASHNQPSIKSGARGPRGCARVVHAIEYRGLGGGRASVSNPMHHHPTTTDRHRTQQQPLAPPPPPSNATAAVSRYARTLNLTAARPNPPQNTKIQRRWGRIM